MRAGAKPHRAGSASAPGLPARLVAVDAVAAALAREMTLDEALARGGDDPLARAIAVTTFRQLGTIRAALAGRMSRGLPKDGRAFAILATGAAQVLFLDVADHAAVDLAVRAAQADGRTRHLAGMVNAVLRRVAREAGEILPGSPDDALPTWLRARWADRYGADRAGAIAAAHAGGAALDLSCQADPGGWAERIGGVLLPTGSVRVLDRRPVTELPGFAEGAIWVQDAAAALPARLLDPHPGERILDLCAAPGGKTAQLAAAGAAVTALDRSEDRLGRLAANLSRLGLSAEIACADAFSFAPAEPFDAVLLDAPCSATGTIRRHPDIPWTKRPEDVASLAGLQARLLDRAAGFVRPGGRLVYCVCSLEPEEGEERVQPFLDRHPDFRAVPIEAGTHGITPDMLTDRGELRTAPDLWPAPPPGSRSPDRGWRPGMDGFFAAIFVRNGT